MRVREPLLVVACACVVAAAPSAPADPPKVDVVTYHGDVASTGQNLAETVLTPHAVSGGGFGRTASLAVDGYVYAQPLVATDVPVPHKGTRDLLIVATEHDSVYAFDVGRAHPRRVWKRRLAPHGERSVLSREVDCNDLVPEIGITSTPTIDLATGTIYVVAKTAAHHGREFHQRLHALDLATGAEKPGGPVEIAASVAGTGDGSDGASVAFDARRQHQRSSLRLFDGSVFIQWASHCDDGPYHGWVMSYDAATLAQTGVFATTPDGGLGGIWQAGGGLSIDAAGGLYAVTGNGTFDADRGGRDYGDTALRLSFSQGLSVADWFTPFDQQSLNDADADLGSGGALVLPDQSGAHPHELVFAGKEGTIYVLDRDAMGGFHAGGDSQIVQSVPGAIGGSYGTPAYWNGRVYWHGAGDDLKCFTVNAGALSVLPSSESGGVAGFPGSTPTVSADGDSGAVVWEIQTDMYGNGESAILLAFDALDLTRRLYTSAAAKRDAPGLPAKFAVPTVANGRVYVGGLKRVAVYGLR